MKISRDVNGNKIVKIEAKDLKHYRGSVKRGFSVQTLGNLSYTHKNDLHCESTTKNEIFDYIKSFGTARQKAAIGADQEYTLQDIIRGYTSESVLFKTDLSDQDVDQLCDVIGGQCKTKKQIGLVLGYHLKTADFWGVSDRFMFVGGDCGWWYCAGQDQPFEMKQVRKHLLK